MLLWLEEGQRLNLAWDYDMMMRALNSMSVVGNVVLVLDGEMLGQVVQFPK